MQAERCVLVCMSGLVCTCNDSAHPHIHPGTHSSSLCLCDSTMVAAVRSLLGRWGLMHWASLVGKCTVRSCPSPQRCSSFGDSNVAKSVPHRWRWDGDVGVSQLLDRGSKSVQGPKTPLIIRCAHHLEKRGGTNRESHAAEQTEKFHSYFLRTCKQKLGKNRWIVSQTKWRHALLTVLSPNAPTREKGMWETHTDIQINLFHFHYLTGLHTQWCHFAKYTVKWILNLGKTLFVPQK